MNPWILPIPRFLNTVQYAITQLPSDREDKEYVKFLNQVTGPLKSMRKPAVDPLDDFAPDWWVDDNDAAQSNAQALAELRRKR